MLSQRLAWRCTPEPDLTERLSITRAPDVSRPLHQERTAVWDVGRSPLSGEIGGTECALRSNAARRTSAPTRRHSTVTSSLLPVSILGFVIVSYIALRPFPSRVRYLFDFACFAGATLILLRHQTPPLPGNGEAADAGSLWLHALAGICLLLGARLLVAVMSFSLNYNRRWREARLFPDLTAAAIYAAAVLVVLISVLA